MPQSCRHPGAAVSSNRDHCSIPALLSCSARSPQNHTLCWIGAAITTGCLDPHTLRIQLLVLWVTSQGNVSDGGTASRAASGMSPTDSNPLGRQKVPHPVHIPPTKDIDPPKTFTAHTREVQSLLQYFWCSATQRCFP